jgi:nitrogen fixation/metabolism regulation signal transduction histidine kinase
MKNGGTIILMTGLFLFVFMLTSLLMMSAALQDSSRFDRFYSVLLVFNTFGLLTLIVLIALNFKRLIRQLRNHTPGARLTIRMVMMFCLLSVTPVLIVYYFSLSFLHQGIDNWFDLRVEQALDDSLELSRLALDVRMRELLKKTEQVASEFTDLSNAAVPFEIDEFRDRMGADELTSLTRQGGVLASSAGETTSLVPEIPNETILLQLQQGNSYIGLDTVREKKLSIRVVANVPGIGIDSEARIIQALFPISEKMNDLAESVQSSFVKYNELSYLREQLKLSFILILTLVLLFSIFSAVWAAFYSARKLAAPIRDLAKGTQSVSEGNYETQLPVPGNDELGFLVASFNAMTSKIAQARDTAKQSQQEAEAQRTHLEVVLSQLSSGVLVLDRQCNLRTANISAGQILGIPVSSLQGHSLEEITSKHQHIDEFSNSINTHLSAQSSEWREQTTLFGGSGHQVLMCSGKALPGENEASYVIVFDDITALLQGQRNAAWSEMARHLAHEIKNPLTPIQLAAERLRHKYLHTMDKNNAEILDRLTNTIVQQVETMKDMVNSFSDFARTPEISPESIDIHELIEEVLDLYINLDKRIHIELQFEAGIPKINGDTKRLRQVLNNLLNNAFEANESTQDAQLFISTNITNDIGSDYVELRIRDSGTGIDDDIIGHIFEPYVTTKTKGTGLGLAIVKKIVEEHGGKVWLENNKPDTGTCAVIQLPVAHSGQQKMQSSVNT